MSSISEKKSEQVAVKLAPATLEMIERICEMEDRPVGYVVRELMVRGLAQYQIDGRLRDMPQTEKVYLAPVIATITPAIDPKAEVRRMVNADEIAEIERRITPRKTQRMAVLKQKAK